MRRVLLILTSGLLIGCVACVLLGYFVAIPRVKDGVQDGVQEAVSTYVAPQIAGLGIVPKPGRYTLDEAQVNEYIQASDASLKDLRLEITPAGLQLRFGEQGQDVAYTAGVSTVDGKIVVDAENLSGIPSWILPASTISHGVENGINTYLAENGLIATSVTLQDGSMTLVLEDATATPAA